MKKTIGYTVLGMGLGASMSMIYEKYKSGSLKRTFKKAENKISDVIDNMN